MVRLLRLELRKLVRPVLAVIVLSTVVFSILSCTLFQNYTLYYILDKWEIGTEFLALLAPFLVTVPICWQLYYERRDRFLVYTLPRISPARYLCIKWISCAICAFALLFVPYLISALCALYLASYQELHPDWIRPYYHVFQTLYTRFPLIYALLISIWKSLLGVLMMSFGFVLALYSSNIFVVLTTPFVYYILDNFLWSSLRIPHALVHAFEPSTLAPVGWITFAWGPLQLILVLFLTALYQQKIRHRRIYPL